MFKIKCPLDQVKSNVPSVSPPYTSEIFEIDDPNSTVNLIYSAWYLLNSHLFKEYVKADPGLIFKDDVFRLALGLLHDHSKGGTPGTSQARDILKKAGLSAFDQSKGNKRKIIDSNRFYWQRDSAHLILLVDQLKKQIKLKKYYRDKTKKLKAVQDIYIILFRKEIPERDIEDHIDQRRDIALAFIAHRFSIPFNTIEKDYKTAKKKITKKDVSKQKKKLFQWWNKGKVVHEWHGKLNENFESADIPATSLFRNLKD